MFALNYFGLIAKSRHHQLSVVSRMRVQHSWHLVGQYWDGILRRLIRVFSMMGEMGKCMQSELDQWKRVKDTRRTTKNRVYGWLLQYEKRRSLILTRYGLLLYRISVLFLLTIIIWCFNFVSLCFKTILKKSTIHGTFKCYSYTKSVELNFIFSGFRLIFITITNLLVYSSKQIFSEDFVKSIFHHAIKIVKLFGEIISTSTFYFISIERYLTELHLAGKTRIV